MSYPRKLPDRKMLRRLYVQENRSLGWIAKQYGVRESTARHTLRRDAERDGIGWPLKRGGKQEWLPRKVQAIHRGRDEVRNVLIAAEIREALEAFGLSQTRFARISGVSQSQISRILAAEHAWARRTTAQKVERAIVGLERRAA